MSKCEDDNLFLLPFLFILLSIFVISFFQVERHFVTGEKCTQIDPSTWLEIKGDNYSMLDYLEIECYLKGIKLYLTVWKIAK